MPLSIVETEQIQYAYHKDHHYWVLHGIDLTLEQGEYLLLSGASGSGKSTLCKTFNGLIPHFYGGTLRGNIRIAGLLTADHSVGALFEHVGMVFQNPEAQLFNSTVKNEIAFGLESLGLARTEIVARISYISEALNLSSLLHRNPHEISGGEQQLVILAAILAIGPKLIILDEPYANLDPYNVRRIRDLLKKINAQGISIVISEHRLRYTVADVHRMVVLNRGQMVLDGSPEEVLARDVESLGLELPISIQAGRRLNLAQIPLDVATLKSLVSEKDLLLDFGFPPVKPFSEKAETVLEVDGISFKSGSDVILDNISFSLKKGECLALVGANGAGKTTLLMHLNGLLRATQGRVLIKGQDTSKFKVSQLARHVGIVFQNPNHQFFKLSVRDEIIAGARALDSYDEKWLKVLTQLFRLEPIMDHSPYRLSGGEKKRVTFAAALATKPAILALDEPTAGQDGYFRRELGDFMVELRSQGMAVLLITHDLTFAEKHAHRWLLMSEGKVVAEGSPRQVMADKIAMDHARLEPTDSFRLHV